jgi:hypothetical protein
MISSSLIPLPAISGLAIGQNVGSDGRSGLERGMAFRKGREQDVEELVKLKAKHRWEYMAEMGRKPDEGSLLPTVAGIWKESE